MTTEIDEITQNFARLAHSIYSTRIDRAMYVKKLVDLGNLDAADVAVMHEMRNSMFCVRQCRANRPEEIYETFKVIGTEALHEIVTPLAGSFCTRRDRNFLMACLKVAYPDKTWTELETLYHEKASMMTNPNLVLSNGLAPDFEQFFNPNGFSVENLPEMDSHFTAFLFGISAHKASQKFGSDKIFTPLFEDVISAFQENQTLTLDDEIYLSGLLRTALMALPFNDQIFRLKISEEPTVLDHLGTSVEHFKKNADFYNTEKFAKHHPDLIETWRNILPALERIREDIEKVSDRHDMFTRPFNTAIEVFSAREVFRLEKIIKLTHSELGQDTQSAEKLNSTMPGYHA